MYVCSVCVCVYVCLCVCVFMSQNDRWSMYVCMYVCIYVCMYVCMYIMCVCVCACVCACRERLLFSNVVPGLSRRDLATSRTRLCPEHPGPVCFFLCIFPLTLYSAFCDETLRP